MLTILSYNLLERHRYFIGVFLIFNIFSLVSAQEITLQCGINNFNPVLSFDKEENNLYYVDENLTAHSRLYLLKLNDLSIDSFPLTDMKDDSRNKVTSIDFFSNKIIRHTQNQISLDSLNLTESTRLFDSSFHKTLILYARWINPNSFAFISGDVHNPKNSYGLFVYNLKSRTLKKVYDLDANDIVFHAFSPSKLMATDGTHLYILQPSRYKILKFKVANLQLVECIDLQPILSNGQNGNISLTSRGSLYKRQMKLMEIYNHGTHNIAEEIFCVSDSAIVVSYTPTLNDGQKTGIRKWLLINGSQQIAITPTDNRINPFLNVPLKLSEDVLSVATFNPTTGIIRIIEQSIELH